MTVPVIGHTVVYHLCVKLCVILVKVHLDKLNGMGNLYGSYKRKLCISEHPHHMTSVHLGRI